MNFFSEIGEDPIEFFSDKSETTRLKAISARGCVALTVPAGTAWLVAKGFQPLIRSRWPTVFTGEFYLSASGKYSFAQWRGDYCRVLYTLPRAAEERAKNVEKEAASARRSAIETRVDALVAAGRAAAGSREAIVEAALKSGDNGEALFASYPERAAASGSPLPAGSQRGGEGGAEDGISLAAAGFKKQMSGE